MKKIAGLVLGIALVLGASQAQATPIYQTQAPDQWQGSTTGTTPVDASCVTINPAVYSQWGTGQVDVIATARGYLSAGNQKIMARRFLLDVSSGSMSLVAQNSLFTDTSVGIGLLLADLSVTINNTNHTACAKVTGVIGQTVQWLVTTTGTATAN